MNKAELIAAAKEQWTTSEAAVAKAAQGNFDAAPAAGGWSAGDTFRHMIDAAHRTPEMMESLVKTGTLTLEDHNEDGIASFKTLKARMLPIELNTAHGIIWMAAQKLTDADLDRTVEFLGNKMPLGALLREVLVGHEQGHVAHALAAAGVSA